MKDIVVAIDGPAGAGKTTVAKIVAKKIGADYCDSGSFYRAICYLALSSNIELTDPIPILELVKKREIKLNWGCVFVDDEDITGYLRDENVSKNVSVVSAHSEIREYVNRILRSQRKPIVIEGRDIGTVVFPETPFKFYLDADLSIRRERRRGERIEERDRIDTNREVAPLARSPDSLLIDTSRIAPEEVAERIFEKVEFTLRRNLLYSLAKVFVPTFMKLYFRLSVESPENVPVKGGVIVCANHSSFLDPPVVGVAMLDRELYYFAKEELFSIPIFGSLIRALNAFPVKRGSFSMSAIKKAVKVLENGGMVLIFPEGTRGESLREPLRGVGLIAELANRNIRTVLLPVRIRGTERALCRGSWFIKPCKVTVRIGRPIFPENLNLSDHYGVAKAVMSEIAKL
jgi:cytidylate kinase